RAHSADDNTLRNPTLRLFPFRVYRTEATFEAASVSFSVFAIMSYEGAPRKRYSARSMVSTVDMDECVSTNNAGIGGPARWRRAATAIPYDLSTSALYNHGCRPGPSPRNDRN